MGKYDEIKKEIKELISDGTKEYEGLCLYAKTYINESIEFTKPEKEKINTFLVNYETWYSSSLRLIKTFLPERVNDFTILYRDEKRKEITSENYTVSDALQGKNTLFNDYYPGNADEAPVFVHFTIKNNGSETLRFKLADDRSFSMDFNAYTVKNSRLEQTENIIEKPNQVMLLEINRTPAITEDKIKETVEKKKPNFRIVRATNIIWSKKNLGLTVPYPSDNYQKPMIKGAKKPAAKKNDDKSPENQLIKLREEMKPKMIYEFFQEKPKAKKKGKKKK